MNNKGKASGLALILMLIVALLVAYLAVTQRSSLGFGNSAPTQQENYVRQAQSLVDQINQAQQQAGQMP